MKLKLVGINRVGDDALKRLWVSCPSLEAVEVNINYFTEAKLRVLLLHLPALRELNINSSKLVKGHCFSLLPDSLQQLSVAYCTGVRSDSLRQVGARCPHLRRLDMAALQVNADDLAAVLAGCPQLEWLSLRFLEEVDFERCLPPAGLPELTHLVISGCNDTTLQELPDLLPSLRTLDISCKLDTTEQRIENPGSYLRRGKWGIVSHLFSWLRGGVTMKIELFFFFKS